MEPAPFREPADLHKGGKAVATPGLKSRRLISRAMGVWVTEGMECVLRAFDRGM